jgi:hypothetical protein
MKAALLVVTGLLLGTFAGGTATAFASVACTMTIDAVQSQDEGTILVQFSNGSWHVVARIGDDFREDRLSLVTAALLSGKQVYFRFTSNSYSCTATNYTEYPTIVRLLK